MAVKFDSHLFVKMLHLSIPRDTLFLSFVKKHFLLIVSILLVHFLLLLFCFISYPFMNYNNCLVLPCRNMNLQTKITTIAFQIDVNRTEIPHMFEITFSNVSWFMPLDISLLLWLLHKWQVMLSCKCRHKEMPKNCAIIFS